MFLKPSLVTDLFQAQFKRLKATNNFAQGGRGEAEKLKHKRETSEETARNR